MSDSFTIRIRPHVERELREAMDARSNESASEEFRHLENAHVLGQASTYWHTRVHLAMLQWALRNNSAKEVLGQVLRLVGAATKTAIGLVPEGNTGGSNVSPFRRMPIAPELQRIIQTARAGA